MTDQVTDRATYRATDLTLEELINAQSSGIHLTTVPFLGFKKVHYETKSRWVPGTDYHLFERGFAIAYVEIPPHEFIIRPNLGLEVGYVSKNLRTNKLIVLEFFDMDGNIMESDSYVYQSIYDPWFLYEKNKTHSPVRLEYIYNTIFECADGLHFFQTFDEAKQYEFT